MGKTKIEWAEHSWNPISGCTPVSPGCKHCYAARMAKRLAGRCGYPKAPHEFDVTLHPDRLDVPLRRKKPTTYFVCSMSDLFHEDVPRGFVSNVFEVINQAPQHIFQILTKRPRRMLEYIRWWEKIEGCSFDLENVWCGVSVENQAMANERIPILLQTPAAVRFVSCEPLLSKIDLFTSLIPIQRLHATPTNWKHLDWVIVGGESGPGARPMHPDWARDIRDQCQAANVPFFFKQWGTWAPGHLNDTVIGVEKLDWASRPTAMSRVGKKRAGRLLDGREWNEVPTPL